MVSRAGPGRSAAGRQIESPTLTHRYNSRKIHLRRIRQTLCAAMVSVLPAGAADADGLDFFEKRVRPLLAAKCQACHNPQLKSGNIDLSSVEGFIAARDEAALISTEEPSSSRLLAMVGYEARIKMPPTGKLPAEEIDVLRDWVSRGAPWPGAEQREAMISSRQQGSFSEEQRRFWAFQPVVRPEPPEMGGRGWARNSIDRFVLAKLEEEGLEPAPETDRLTWLRRASFDLTGLPPTPQEANAFLSDDSPLAFERVVERLLASPHYGQRWGRHWLDVARYADSTGNDEDHRYPYAWKYRDYVIAAFNDDLPYDQFVREQVAGDLLPDETGREINERGTIATGFLALGPKAIAQQDKTRMLYDVYDEQIEVVSKSMLGLTVACARCHDHKFDPILTKDYYSLAGMFASTRSFKDARSHVSRMLLKPLVPQEEYERYEAEQAEIRNKGIELANLADIEIENYVDSVADRIADYMLGAREAYEDGGDPAAIAQLRNLDADQLAKWIAYLRPGDTPRAQLATWHEAMTSERADVAADYQDRFGETLADWHYQVRRWRKGAIVSLKEGLMPPPPKPRFRAGQDRFFYDVYHAKAGPLRFADDERDGILRPETVGSIKALRAEVAELKAKAMPEPPMANAVEEGVEVDQRVFVRGDYSAEGEAAPKVFPAIIAGFDQEPVKAGSGR